MMNRTLYCGAIALVLIAVLVSAVLASDVEQDPDTIWLYLCLEGGSAKETFTVTSYYPQTVEIYVKDHNIPNDIGVGVGIPVAENGWILNYGESATVTFVSTQPGGGSRWFRDDIFEGWLGISVDDAVTHENLEYLRENVIVRFDNCRSCDLDLTPPIELTMCPGETAVGTFTATSTCPQEVYAGIYSIYITLPDGSVKFPYYTEQHVPIVDDYYAPGGIWKYNEPHTGTVTVTARNKDGTLCDPGVYTIGLYYNLDELYSNINLGGPGEIVTLNVIDCEATPEFPSAVLPVTAIIAFLATILYIRKTRES